MMKTFFEPIISYVRQTAYTTKEFDMNSTATTTTTAQITITAVKVAEAITSSATATFAGTSAEFRSLFAYLENAENVFAVDSNLDFWADDADLPTSITVEFEAKTSDPEEEISTFLTQFKYLQD